MKERALNQRRVNQSEAKQVKSSELNWEEADVARELRHDEAGKEGGKDELMDR